MMKRPPRLDFLRRRGANIYCALTLLLLFAPPVLIAAQQDFYLEVLTRALILAIAVAGLNLIVGGGGMLSLGHAAYIGIGAYSVGIPLHYGVDSGIAHLGIAVGGGMLFAWISGLVCLRAKGLYFILSTLAFSQLLYFTFVSLEEYGADDGLVIRKRSNFAGVLDLENPLTLYYLTCATLLLLLFLLHKLTHARFGRVLFAIKHNPRRMQSLGYNTYRYQLVCYVLSGGICGVAGFLLGNFTYYISPEMMDWIHSAELIFMLVIGGVGALFGPLLGALAFIALEELLSDFTVYWQLIFGLLLIAAALLFGAGGLHNWLLRLAAAAEKRHRRQKPARRA